MDRRFQKLFAGVGAVFFWIATLNGQNASNAGKVDSSWPTFHNLALSWPVDGDVNQNGQVTIRYREKGARQWHSHLQLFRIPPGANVGFQWENKHSGSVFGLKPGTAYDVELSLADRDGGNQTRLVEVATRPWPKIANQGKRATPDTIDDEVKALTPGGVLVLADGVYRGITVTSDGSKELPVVIRSENSGGAVIEGELRADGRSHVQFVGLTVNGKVKFNNASNIVVCDCVINTQNDGVVAYGERVSNILVLGNTLTGPTIWKESSMGAEGDNLGEGIVLTGPGNVVAFNRVQGFRDGISLVEDSGAFNQQSIDIFGNDIYQCADDGIEADFSMGNVRVYENRITDCFMGISSQPSLGGPTYFVRNVLYNSVLQEFKLQRSSVGDIGLHNTVVKSGDALSVKTNDVWSQAWFRNNIFIGSPGGRYNGYNTGKGRVMYLPTADDSCDFDFNGYGSIGTERFEGVLNDVRFQGLEQMRAMTTEANAIQVGLNVFENPIVIPVDPIQKHAVPGLSLGESSAAIDVGCALPGINDAFTGQSPDLGAYEYGQPIPKYGPEGCRELLKRMQVK